MKLNPACFAGRTNACAIVLIRAVGHDYQSILSLRAAEVPPHPTLEVPVPRGLLMDIKSGSELDSNRGQIGVRVGLSLLARNNSTLTPFSVPPERWRKLNARCQAQARAAPEQLCDTEGLSRDVAEIIGKALT